MNFVSEFLLNGREDLRGLGGVKYSSKPLVFNSPNWGNLEGEWKGVIPLILKKKIIVNYALIMSIHNRSGSTYIRKCGSYCQFI